MGSLCPSFLNIPTTSPDSFSYRRQWWSLPSYPSFSFTSVSTRTFVSRFYSWWPPCFFTTRNRMNLCRLRNSARYRWYCMKVLLLLLLYSSLYSLYRWNKIEYFDSELARYSILHLDTNNLSISTCHCVFLRNENHSPLQLRLNVFLRLLLSLILFCRGCHYSNRRSI